MSGIFKTAIKRVRHRLKPRYRIGSALRFIADHLLRPYNTPPQQRIWIDVGSHLGERTFHHAQADPNLTVYAFEPNIDLVVQRQGRLPNFHVFAQAVSNKEGQATFHITAYDYASSLLPLDPDTGWDEEWDVSVAETRTVPTVRLDNFMDRMQIDEVDFLKIDAQGHDFAVIRSAGERIRDVKHIDTEVMTGKTALYIGEDDKREMIEYLLARGFILLRIGTVTNGWAEDLEFIRADVATLEQHNRAISVEDAIKTSHRVPAEK